MGRLRVAWLCLLGLGCSRGCHPGARNAAGSGIADGGAVAAMEGSQTPVDAGPPVPYVRQVKALPPLPRQANVQQIFIGDSASRMPWNPARARKRSPQEAKAIAERLAAEARRGADFDQLARRESDWPTAARNGAALGIVTEGELGMLPIIDPKIFTLKVGEVTDPFQSGMGFHVLKKLPMLHLAHILIAVRDPKSAAPRTVEEARVLAAQAEAELKGGKPFGEVALELSDDLTSAGRGGDLGGVDERSGLAPALRTAAQALAVEEVSAPVEQSHGIEILKRLE